jgi:hypothetical protein
MRSLQAFFTVYCSSTVSLAQLANGRDYFSGELMDVSTTVSDSDLQTLVMANSSSIQLLIISEVFYIITMITLKLSLGVFFLRIMVEPWQKRSVYVIVTISTLMGIAYFLFALFICGLPVDAHFYWVRRFEGGCASSSTILGISYSHAVVTALTDLLLALLPLPMVKKATITSKEKIVVMTIFTIATAYVSFTAPYRPLRPSS